MSERNELAKWEPLTRRVETQRKFIVGCDLGQVADYTSVVFLERLQDVVIEHLCTAPAQPGPQLLFGEDWQAKVTVEPASYHVRYLERMLDIPYSAVVDRVKHLVEQPEIGGRYALVVDQTGVGRPVFELFAKAGLQAYGLTIVGGDGQSVVSKTEFRVSKQRLVGVTQVVTQAKEPQRILYAAGLTGLEVLRSEISTFKVKTTKAANEIYEAREGAHDDVILSLALALWFGETYGDPRPKATSRQMKW